MNADIRMQLLTLSHGERLLRLEDDATGLGIERKVQSAKPLVAQNASLMKICETALKSEHISA